MTFGFICIKNAKMPPGTRMILLQKCNMWKGKNVAKGDTVGNPTWAMTAWRLSIMLFTSFVQLLVDYAMDKGCSSCHRPCLRDIRKYFPNWKSEVICIDFTYGNLVIYSNVSFDTISGKSFSSLVSVDIDFTLSWSLKKSWNYHMYAISVSCLKRETDTKQRNF